VLTQLSRFWFERFRDVVPNHVVTTDVSEFPTELRQFADQLEGRAMLARKAKPLPVECVIRGYLAGSGWKEYREHGTVCGARLPDGLKQAEKLPEPIFTPSTKASSGHDENISEAKLADVVGAEVSACLKRICLDIYTRAASYAQTHGIIIADTKLEFGFVGDQLLWIDEALTPDSSRFWDQSEYRTGESPASFDKQFVRDYLETIGWDKTPPGPRLPAEIIGGTTARYREAFQRITGTGLG
jgi:phosphoribosylaminoimidazole-succinocarboxamide synthase